MGVVTQGVKHSMNPFDEIALEEVSQVYCLIRRWHRMLAPHSVYSVMYLSIPNLAACSFTFTLNGGV